MTDSSKTPQSPVKDVPQYNDTWILSGPYHYFDVFTLTFSPFICLTGLLGNGMVICLLSFHIKRSCFMTYILNLAVADFGVLLFWGLNFLSLVTDVKSILFFVLSLMAATFMHNASQLLLTAISIDRCVSVLFPIWHRCQRPPRQSTRVCALIWALDFLLSGSLAMVYSFQYSDSAVFFYPFIVAAVLCLPLVMISTMILLSKVTCRPQQPRRGRLLTIILLALLFFLIFSFPLNVIFTLNCFVPLEYHYLIYGFLCTSLNSCVNPAIYYMVGRKRRSQQRQSLEVILQRAFKEEEEHREERGTTAQTSL